MALRRLRWPSALLGKRLSFYCRFELVPALAELIAGALDLHQLHSLTFYDALIVQAASCSGCQRLRREDLKRGAVIAGVRLENPFLTV